MTIHTLAFKKSSQAIHYARRLRKSPRVRGNDMETVHEECDYIVIDYDPSDLNGDLWLYQERVHSVEMADEPQEVYYLSLKVLKQIVLEAGL